MSNVEVKYTFAFDIFLFEFKNCYYIRAPVFYSGKNNR